jgi:hypothetical protein
MAGNLTFEAFDVGKGDAILLTGNKPKATRMLVDGGPKSDCEPLLTHLKDLLAANGGKLTLDMVLVTHVDDDHIGGIQALLREIQKETMAGLTVKRLWQNAFDDVLQTDFDAKSDKAVEQFLGMLKKDQTHADTADFAVSVAQGREVRRMAHDLGFGPAPTQGELVAAGLTAPFSIGDVKWEVLAPSKQSLKRMKTEWMKDVKTRVKAGKCRKCCPVGKHRQDAQDPAPRRLGGK